MIPWQKFEERFLAYQQINYIHSEPTFYPKMYENSLYKNVETIKSIMALSSKGH